MRQPRPEGRYQTVVLIRSKIGNADGVPLIEQISKICPAMLDVVGTWIGHIVVITETRR